MARSTPDRPRGSTSKRASSSGKRNAGGLHYYGTGKGGCVGIGLLVLLTMLIVGVAVGVVLGIFLIGD